MDKYTILQLERDVTEKARELLSFANMDDEQMPTYVYDGPQTTLAMRTPIIADDDRGGQRSDDRKANIGTFQNHEWSRVVEEEGRKLFENAIAYRTIRRIDLNSQIDRPQDTDSGDTKDTDDVGVSTMEACRAGQHAGRLHRQWRLNIEEIGCG